MLPEMDEGTRLLGLLLIVFNLVLLWFAGSYHIVCGRAKRTWFKKRRK